MRLFCLIVFVMTFTSCVWRHVPLGDACGEAALTMVVMGSIYILFDGLWLAASMLWHRGILDAIALAGLTLFLTAISPGVCALAVYAGEMSLGWERSPGRIVIAGFIAAVALRWICFGTLVAGIASLAACRSISRPS